MLYFLAKKYGFYIFFSLLHILVFETILFLYFLLKRCRYFNNFFYILMWSKLTITVLLTYNISMVNVIGRIKDPIS